MKCGDRNAVAWRGAAMVGRRGPEISVPEARSSGSGSTRRSGLEAHFGRASNWEPLCRFAKS